MWIAMQTCCYPNPALVSSESCLYYFEVLPINIYIYYFEVLGSSKSPESHEQSHPLPDTAISLYDTYPKHQLTNIGVTCALCNALFLCKKANFSDQHL